MSGREEEARFRCAIAIAQPDETLHLFRGMLWVIAKRPGKGGFGYDSIFYVPAAEKRWPRWTRPEEQD